MSETNLQYIYDKVTTDFPEYKDTFGTYEEFQEKMLSENNKESIRKLLLNKYDENIIGDSTTFSNRTTFSQNDITVSQDDSTDDFINAQPDNLIANEILNINDDTSGILDKTTFEQEDFDNPPIDDVIPTVPLPDDIVTTDDVPPTDDVIVEPEEGVVDSIDYSLGQINSFWNPTSEKMFNKPVKDLDVDEHLQLMFTIANDKKLNPDGWDAWTSYKEWPEDSKYYQSHQNYLEAYTELTENGVASFKKRYNVPDELLQKVQKIFGKDWQIAASVIQSESGWGIDAINENIIMPDKVDEDVDEVVEEPVEEPVDIDKLSRDFIEKHYGDIDLNVTNLNDNLNYKFSREDLIDISTEEPISTYVTPVPVELRVKESVEEPGEEPVEESVIKRYDEYGAIDLVDIIDVTGFEALGLAEVPITIVSGLISMGWGGILASLDRTDMPLDEKVQMIDEIVSKGTYEPRTTYGEGGVQFVSFPFELLEEGATYASDYVYEHTGNPYYAAITQAAIEGSVFLFGPFRAKYKSFKKSKTRYFKNNEFAVDIFKGDKKMNSAFWSEMIYDDVIVKEMSVGEIMKKYNIPEKHRSMFEFTVNEIKESWKAELVDIPYEIVEDTKVSDILSTKKPTVDVKNISEVIIETQSENKHIAKVLDKDGKILDIETYPTFESAEQSVILFLETSIPILIQPNLKSSKDIANIIDPSNPNVEAVKEFQRLVMGMKEGDAGYGTFGPQTTAKWQEVMDIKPDKPVVAEPPVEPPIVEPPIVEEPPVTAEPTVTTEPLVTTEPPVADIKDVKISSKDKKRLKDTTVIDDVGEPLSLYHGTTEVFDKFEITKDIGFHLGSLNQAKSRVFDSRNNKYYEGANIRIHYADIKKPLYLEDLDNWWPDDISTALKEQGFEKVPEFGITDKSPEHYKALRDYLQNEGYDGIIYNNPLEGKAPESSLTIKDRDAYDATFFDFAKEKKLTPKERIDWLQKLENQKYDKGDLIDLSYVVFDEKQIVSPITAEPPVVKPKVTPKKAAPKVKVKPPKKAIIKKPKVKPISIKKIIPETLPDKLLVINEDIKKLEKRESLAPLPSSDKKRLGQLILIQSNIRGKMRAQKKENIDKDMELRKSAKSFQNKLDRIDSQISSLKNKKKQTSGDKSYIKRLEKDKAKLIDENNKYEKEVLEDVVLRLEKTLSDYKKQIKLSKSKPSLRTPTQVKALNDRLRKTHNLIKKIEKGAGISIAHQVYGQVYSTLIPPGLVHIFKIIERKIKIMKKKPLTEADINHIDYISRKGGDIVPYDMDIGNENYIRDKGHRLFLEKIRKRKLEIFKSNLKVSKWNKLVPKELDRFDIGAYAENIANILIDGDTAALVRDRMTPKKSKVLTEYKIAIEQARRDINGYLEEFANTQGEYLSFLKNYLPHFYVTNNKVKFTSAIDIIKNSPNAKKRKLPTLQDALDAGLSPISQDPGILYAKYVDLNWSMATNKMFLHQLSKMIGPDGKRIVLPANKNTPADYVLFDHPLFKRVFSMPNKKGQMIPGNYGIKVHPQLKPVLNMLEEYQFDYSPEGISTVGRAWDKANSIFKSGALSFSLFHHITLGESALSVFGGINPIRGIFMFFEKNPIDGKRRVLQTPHRLGLEIIKDEKIFEDALMHGLQIEHSNIDNHTGTWIELRDGLKNFKPLAKNALWRKTVGGILDYSVIGFQKLLWGHYHSGLKMLGWYETQTQFMDLYPELSPTEVKEFAAYAINNSFGGQEWESKLFLGNPTIKKWTTRGLLAPDWTYSVFMMGYEAVSSVKEFVTGKRLPGTDPRFRDPKFRKAKAKFQRIYWKNMLISLATAHVAAQYAIYQAFGDDEAGDQPYIWNNEIGEKWNVDVTPLFRYIAKSMGREWTTKTRYYSGAGKQFKELFGYVDGIFGLMNTLKRKSSPMVAFTWELASGYTTSGYPAEWHEKFTEGEYWQFPYRFLESGTPFALRGNSFIFSLPLHKGMTRREATDIMTNVIVSYVDPNIYQRMINKYGTEKLEGIFGKNFENYETELENFFPEVMKALELNGFNSQAVLKNVISNLAKEYHNELIDVARDEDGNWKNPDDMTDKDKFLMDYTSYKLVKLDKSVESFYRSLIARKKAGTIQVEDSEFFDEWRSIWSESYEGLPDMDGVSSDWKIDAFNNLYFTKYQKDILNINRLHIKYKNNK